MDYGSFKDFESVRLKATYNIEIGNRTIEPGETIAYFDKIQISGLSEVRDYITAHGGYEDRTRVIWDRTKELQLTFNRGVFTKEQMALWTNAQLVETNPTDVIKTPMREYLETNANCVATCKYVPVHDIYVYDKATGAKLQFTLDGKEITIANKPFLEIIVDYDFDYNGGGQLIKIGKRLLTGFVELEGITRVKDDTTGQVVTGIIRIPHLRLMSDLSIRLGVQANPVSANFKAVGVPVGSRGDTRVVEFYFLEDDIQADF